MTSILVGNGLHPLIEDFKSSLEQVARKKLSFAPVTSITKAWIKSRDGNMYPICEFVEGEDHGMLDLPTLESLSVAVKSKRYFRQNQYDIWRAFKTMPSINSASKNVVESAIRKEDNMDAYFKADFLEFCGLLIRAVKKGLSWDDRMRKYFFEKRPLVKFTKDWLGMHYWYSVSKDLSTLSEDDREQYWLVWRNLFDSLEWLP
jgi:hypothetical protein